MLMVIVIVVCVSVVAYDRLRFFPYQLQTQVFLLQNGSKYRGVAEIFENHTEYNQVILHGADDIWFKALDGSSISGEDIPSVSSQYRKLFTDKYLPTAYRLDTGEPHFFAFDFTRKKVSGEASLVFQYENKASLPECKGRPTVNRTYRCYVEVNEDWQLLYLLYETDLLGENFTSPPNKQLNVRYKINFDKSVSPARSATR